MDGKLRNMTSVYITNADQMLLLLRQGGRVVNNVWVGSAGGHFEDFELNDARACILRELEEELSLKANDLKSLSLRYVTLRWINGEIRQNYYFFAELNKYVNRNLTSNEGICKWFDYSELLSLEMPFTAKYVIAHYLETGHKTDAIYGGVADGEKVVFTQISDKLYLDMTEKPCISIYIKDAEVIPAGTTVYSMPVKDKNDKYNSLAAKYDIHFIFDDHIPAIDFYSIPHIDIMATDSSGGFLGTLGEISDLNGKAQICYIDHDRNCFIAASNFKELLDHLSDWKERIIPCGEIEIFDSKEQAMERHKFIEINN